MTAVHRLARLAVVVFPMALANRLSGLCLVIADAGIRASRGLDRAISAMDKWIGDQR